MTLGDLVHVSDLVVILLVPKGNFSEIRTRFSQKWDHNSAPLLRNY